MRHPNNKIHLTRALAYVDTEWTELDPENRRIVSIAVTRFNTDSTQQSAYWLVNPKRKISPESSRIHGISQEDIANQPEFRVIANEVEAILEDADIAGYSVTNDIEMIEREMAIARKEWNASERSIVDAFRLWQVREPRTLRDAHLRFVGPVPETVRAHDARGDVTMTIAIINAMQEGKTVSELHEEAHPGMVDPAGKFRMQDGTTVYNFGPYRGLPVSDHTEYLEWMLSKQFAPSTIEAAQNLLARFRMDDECDDYNDECDDDECDDYNDDGH